MEIIVSKASRLWPRLSLRLLAISYVGVVGILSIIWAFDMDSSIIPLIVNVITLPCGIAANLLGNTFGFLVAGTSIETVASAAYLIVLYPAAAVANVYLVKLVMRQSR